MIGVRLFAATLATCAVAAGCKGHKKDQHDGAVAGAAAATDAAPESRPPSTIVLDEVEVRLHGAADGALASRELARELGRCVIDGERERRRARTRPSRQGSAWSAA